MRKLLLIAMGLLGALLAIELALQVLAYVAWARGQRAAPASGAATVLCVGDSYTWGMGASDASFSYPKQLQAELHKAGLGVEVVNAGWPGQTSRSVLLRLENQLREYRPRLVYVLIGLNDLSWSPPHVSAAEAEQAAGDASFPLELRLPRLARLIGKWLAGGPDYGRDATRPQWVGVWHAGTREVRIEPDGRLLAGGHPLWWYRNGERLIIVGPGPQEFDGQWRMRGDDLVLAVPGFAEPLELAPGPPTEVPLLEQARRAATEGKHAQAIELFEKAQAEDSIGAHLGLVRSQRALGHEQAAREGLAWLQARLAEGKAGAADATLRALFALGDVGQAIELTGKLMEKGVTVTPIWELMTEVSQDPAKHEELQAIIGRLLADQRVQGVFRVHLMRAHYLVMKEQDPLAAMRILLEAELLASHEPFTRSRLQDPAFTKEMLEQNLASMPISDEQRRHLRGLWTQGSPAEAKMLETLRDHLAQMVERCRRHGAVAVLLTYPFRELSVERVVRQVAGATGADTIAVQAEFEKLLQGHRWEEYFVVDGHCSDRGYGVIAGLVARHAIAHLR